MKKKLIALAAIIIILLASYLWLGKAIALFQAKTFKPRERAICAPVATPAIHTESGARYTFDSGCLPTGWEVDKKATPVPDN